MNWKEFFKKYKGWIIIVAIIVLFFLLNQYERAGISYYDDEGEVCTFFERTSENCTTTTKCYHAYKRCGCLGIITAGESYPPSYRCMGLQLCYNINKTQCVKIPT